VLSAVSPLPPQLQSAAASAAGGDILPLKLVVLDVLLAPADGSDRACNPQTDPVVAIACHITHTSSSSSASSNETASSSQTGTQQQHEAGSSGGGCGGSNKVVFLLSGPGAAAVLPGELRVESCCVVLCPSEVLLLTAWRDWLQQQDPDGLVVFQVGPGFRV